MQRRIEPSGTAGNESLISGRDLRNSARVLLMMPLSDTSVTLSNTRVLATLFPGSPLGVVCNSYRLPIVSFCSWTDCCALTGPIKVAASFHLHLPFFHHVCVSMTEAPWKDVHCHHFLRKVELNWHVLEQEACLNRTCSHVLCATTVRNK